MTDFTGFPDTNGRTDRVPALLEALAGRPSTEHLQAAAHARASVELWAYLELRQALQSSDFGITPAAVPALPVLLGLAATKLHALRLLAQVRVAAQVDARFTLDEDQATFLEECRQVLCSTFRSNVPYFADLLIDDDERAALAIGILSCCDDAIDSVWSECEAHFAVCGAALCTASMLNDRTDEQRALMRQSALVLLDRWRESPPATLGPSLAALALVSSDARGAELELGLEALLTASDDGWFVSFGSGRLGMNLLRSVVRPPDRSAVVLELATRLLSQATGVMRVRLFSRLLHLDLGEPVVALVKAFAPWNDPEAAEVLRRLISENEALSALAG